MKTLTIETINFFHLASVQGRLARLHNPTQPLPHSLDRFILGLEPLSLALGLPHCPNKSCELLCNAISFGFVFACCSHGQPLNVPGKRHGSEPNFFWRNFLRIRLAQTLCLSIFEGIVSIHCAYSWHILKLSIRRKFIRIDRQRASSCYSTIFISKVGPSDIVDRRS